MSEIRRVLVVGGGIGGLSAAIALRGVGVEVVLVERNPAWDVYGVGIIQPPNALRALDALGVAERCIAAGHGILGGRNHLADGTLLGEDDYPPADPRFPPMNGLTRPALHEILKSAALQRGIEVRVPVMVRELQELPDGVAVIFADGSSDVFDLVVGADGLHSRMRQLLFGPDVAPRYTGQACFRYNLPRLEGLERIHVYISGEAGTAGFVPLSDELMYLLYITKWPEDELDIPAQDLADVLRARLEPFGGDIAAVRDQIVDPARVVYRPVESILVPRPWYRGRALLTGDAAHGTSPHAGQGAAQAIEDGVVLAEEIARGGRVEEVLGRFMERRFERCKAVVELSGAIGAWEQHPDPSVDPTAIRNELMAICAAPV
jgi:2-polyprenyl-6-methoxyphenol hydroxylase-like FAD-dependent oxidoreductase